MSSFIRYRAVMKDAMQISTRTEPVTRRSFLSGASIVSCDSAAPPLAVMADSAEDTVFGRRQYTLYGGRRDTLISLFEKSFIESQDAVGAHVIGTFRDLDDPDRFVWLRGFRDTQARPQALEAFYGSSPAWLTHKKEANATMLDSDNVLLLRPMSSPPSFRSSAPMPGSRVLYGVTIYYLDGVDEAQFAAFFDQAILPHMTALGVHPIAILTTNEMTNNFPRLPIREH